MIGQELYKFQEKVNSLHNWLQNKAGTLRYFLLIKVLVLQIWQSTWFLCEALVTTFKLPES